MDRRTRYELEHTRDEGCGCLSILIPAAVLWALVAVFTDYRLGCCSAIIIVLVVILIYRLLRGR